MSQSKPVRFSQPIRCGHCGNLAPMKVVASFDQLKSDPSVPDEFSWEEGLVYDILLCPSCDKVIFRNYYYDDRYTEDDDMERYITILYPSNQTLPQGLPPLIKSAYEAALKVKPIDANAYAVLLGRVIEMVCDDRNATGKSLSDKLSDLATKGEIPTKLVGVAGGIRMLRNVGAHATLGNLTPAEVPILGSLIDAILEYVYSAPHLAQLAQQMSSKFRSAKQTTKAAKVSKSP
jgi:hypothetical protein